MKLERTRWPGIYRRGVSYVAVVPYGTGRSRKQRWITAPSLRAAQNARREFLDRLSKGVKHSDATMRLSELAEDWCAWLESENGARPSTLVRYRRAMRVVIPALDDAMLKDVTRDSLTDLRRDRPLEHRVLGAMLSYAVAERQLLESNPARAARTKRTRGARKEARHLDKDEALRMLVAVAGTRLEGAVVLGLVCGLRLGEVCGLRWGDIRTTQKKDGAEVVRLHVERQWNDEPTKNGEPRSLVLDPQTVARLERVRIRQAEDLLMIGIRQDGDTLVLGCHPHTLQSWFKDFCGAISFDASFHTLRHTAAIAMLSSGVDVRTAAGRLGNTPAVLLRTYAHFVPSADEAAAEAVETWFAAAK
jgi:integrase